MQCTQMAPARRRAPAKVLKSSCRSRCSPAPAASSRGLPAQQGLGRGAAWLSLSGLHRSKCVRMHTHRHTHIHTGTVPSGSHASLMGSQEVPNSRAAPGGFGPQTLGPGMAGLHLSVPPIGRLVPPTGCPCPSALPGCGPWPAVEAHASHAVDEAPSLCPALPRGLAEPSPHRPLAPQAAPTGAFFTEVQGGDSWPPPSHTEGPKALRLEETVRPSWGLQCPSCVHPSTQPA